jgi:hypothetical protein
MTGEDGMTRRHCLAAATGAGATALGLGARGALAQQVISDFKLPDSQLARAATQFIRRGNSIISAANFAVAQCVVLLMTLNRSELRRDARSLRRMLAEKDAALAERELIIAEHLANTHVPSM